MTTVASHRLSFLRIGLAMVVAADLLSLFFFLGDARANALSDKIPFNAFVDLFSATAVRGIIALTGIAATAYFARKPGRLGAGLIALSALCLLSTVHAQLFGSPWRHLFYSGLCLSGWLLGLAVSRRRGAPEDESFARSGSIALLGTAYLNAGLSKLVYGGVAWVSGRVIQVIIVGQDGLVADGILSSYRSWVANSPSLAGLFSVATLALELAGPLMIVGRRSRLCVALGLIAMHANIYLLADILYWESMALLVLFGLSPEVAEVSADARPVPEFLGSNRRLVATAGILALTASLAIHRQSSRYAHRAQPPFENVAPPELFTVIAPPTGSAPAASVPPVPVTPLTRVGPFELGEAITEGWSITELTLSAEGLVLSLAGPPGRTKFEITCASSANRSPFDIGAAHIFFWKDLALRDIENPGKALQQRLRDAAKGHDICEYVESWHAAASAATPAAPD